MSLLDNKKFIDENESEIDFFTLIYQLIEHKWLVIFSTLVCIGMGIFYTSKWVPVYQSDVLVQIESGENSNSLASMLGAVGNQSYTFVRNNNTAVTQGALIKSRYILSSVIESLGLNILAVPQNNGWRYFFNPPKASIAIKQFSVPKTSINKNFTLIYDKENSVKLLDSNKNVVLHGAIDASLASQDEKIHLQVEKLDAPVGTKFTLIYIPVDMVVSSIAKQLKMEDVDQKGSGIFSISIQNKNASLSTKIVNKVAQVAQQKDIEKKSMEAKKIKKFLLRQLPITEKSLIKAEQAYNQFRGQKGQIDIGIQTKQLIQQLFEFDKKIDELRLNKHIMSIQYTNEHPTYIEIDRRLKIAQNEKYRIEESIKKLSEKQQEFLNLTREVKTKSALLSMILGKIENLKIVEAGFISNIKILSLAKVPGYSLPHPKYKIYLVSVLAGLMLSVLIIFSRKMLFPKIDDPYWTETHFEIPNLAIIPYSKELGNKRSIGDNMHSIPLLAQINHRSACIEALRSLRTSLQVHLSCASNNVVSILGVYSGVGKTFISANLAYLLATSDKRVLLIDADLRRGIAHKYFNTEPSPGLSEIIQGAISVEEALKPSSHKNLTVLTRGSYPLDPSELLASAPCKQLLLNLSKQYDVIIMDTAPVLLVTDAALISSLSATNYLVVASKTHQPSDLEVTLKRLVSAGVKVHGSIFNFHRATSHNNAYYAKYASYDHYYDDNEQQRRRFFRKNKSIS